jgi:hypothetical protein
VHKGVGGPRNCHTDSHIVQTAAGDTRLDSRAACPCWLGSVTRATAPSRSSSNDVVLSWPVPSLQLISPWANSFLGAQAHTGSHAGSFRSTFSLITLQRKARGDMLTRPADAGKSDKHPPSVLVHVRRKPQHRRHIRTKEAFLFGRGRLIHALFGHGRMASVAGVRTG